MKRWKAALIIFVIITFVFSVSAVKFEIGVVADPSASITAYEVKGNANLSNPGSESFWNSIPWTSVPLSANVPNGGHTALVNVKAAWNGTNVFILLSWNATNPSNRMSSVFSLGGGPFGFPPLWLNSSSGQYVVAPPRNEEENIVKQYYTNSTYYSQDRVAMMWYLGGQTGTPDDCMVVGQSNGGALQYGGAANIWDFMTGATWNTSTLFLPQIGMSEVPLSQYYSWWNRNVSFTGVNYPAPPTGFALNLYTNSSNLYEVGLGTGLFYDDVATNLTNPYSVSAGASMGSDSWTVEMSRSLQVPNGGEPYLVNLEPGSTYDVAFAVWQGYLGENAFIKSISTFQTLYLSTQPPPSIVVPGQGLVGPITPYELVTLIGFVLALVVLVSLAFLTRRRDI
jgi:Ethylbenzene dehydrogenase.